MTPSTVQERDIGKPRNPYYEKDIVYIFKHSKWILNSIGIWPSFLKDSNPFQQYFSIVLCNIVLLFAILPFTLYLVLEEKNLMIKVKLTGFLCFCWICVLKYWALIACKPNLKNCIEFVQHDWREVEQREDREVMLKYGNLGRNLTLLCVVFLSSGGFMYHTIAQYTIGSYVNEHNRTIKPLVYPPYSRLFDPQPRPFYELVYTVHSLNGYILFAITVGACGLSALFATHICGQIDIMIQRLQKLAQLGANTDLHPKLVKIVHHHVRMLRFSTAVGTLLQDICFLEFIGSTLIICILEYHTITDWKINNTISLITTTMLLLSLMFNILIMCYIGDLLVEKTSNVGSLCFMIDWYKFPVETMRSLILIIAMSNYPAKISAGHIVDLNLATFGSILKTSLAYLSFLRTTVM